MVAHAALETYSVLTRLPPPLLRSRFPEPLLCLSGERYQSLVATLAEGQIQGGQVYDALIGLTAAEHGVTLVSFDQRAALIYETMGVRVERSD